jgi:hypothetical protein
VTKSSVGNFRTPNWNLGLLLVRLGVDKKNWKKFLSRGEEDKSDNYLATGTELNTFQRTSSAE